MIPKFTIRQLLWAMVGIGLLSLCMSSAARGNRVAFGISVAVIAAVIPISAYAVVHWASFAVANFMKLISNRGSADTKGQKKAAIVGVIPESGVQSESVVADDSDRGAEHV